MPVTIKVLKGEGEEKARELVFEKNTILIGRGTGEDVQLRNDSVSRRHCVIERQGAKWTVMDENTENGTYLNGNIVKTRTTIKHGDVLELGEVMLMVGIDKPLDDLKPKMTPEMQIGRTVLILNILAILFAFVFIGAAAKVYLQYEAWSKAITKNITPEFGDVRSPENNNGLKVLDFDEMKTMVFALPSNLPGTAEEASIWYVAPEWNPRDIWDTSNYGREPRIFEGLDVRLAGGDIFCFSSYFYLFRTFEVPDKDAPYGEIQFFIEGWGGNGPRIGKEEFPLVRREEIPHYVRSIRLYPEHISDYMPSDPAEGMHDGEIGKFTYERKLSPNPKFYPKMRQVLAGIVLPELEEETVVFEGRCFSFYHQGCRYEAVVRGTASTFKRLGGIDKVADAFYSTIRFPDANQDQQRKAESDLKALAAEKVTFIEAFDDKPTVIDVLRYKDLLEVREVILDLQRYPKQLAIEDVLKRNYFNLRQKAQQELEFAMDIIDENYGKTDPREGIAQLERIDTFLGDYPPSTLTPGNANYPEWGLYYEAVRKTSTYKQR